MNGTVYNYRMEGARYGVSFGTALAIAISYTNNHSILWAIIHGFFSWLYVHRRLSTLARKQARVSPWPRCGGLASLSRRSW